MLPDGAVEAVGIGRPAVGGAGQPQFANGPLANWRALLLRVLGGSRDSLVWRHGARSNRATACCTIGGRQRRTPSGHLPRAQFNELHVNLPQGRIRLKQLLFFSDAQISPLPRHPGKPITDKLSCRLYILCSYCGRIDSVFIGLFGDSATACCTTSSSEMGYVQRPTFPAGLALLSFARRT
jgi:hypothetical protein